MNDYDSYYIVAQHHIKQTTIRAIPRDCHNATILRSPKVCRQLQSRPCTCRQKSSTLPGKHLCQTVTGIPVVNFKEPLVKTRQSDNWDDDVTTTTSGSYVVDSDELWQYPEQTL